MERIEESLQHNDAQDFMGMEGFVWWYGVVEDRKDPLFIGRVKVRCVGFHTDDKSLIPTDDLPWAQVIMPVTSASISGIGTTPTGPLEGTHVFGFFRDGREAQEPVVIGTCVGIPGTVANNKRGFFDPRNERERKECPYPPLFIDRSDEGTRAKIVNFDRKSFGKTYIFSGKNDYTDKQAYVEYTKEQSTDKVMVNIRSGDEILSTYQAFSPNPNENNMRFDPATGGMIWSLPSTNINSGNKISFTKGRKKSEKSVNPVSYLLSKSERIHVELEEAYSRIHSNIPTLFAPSETLENTFNAPARLRDPEYPFNHVTYTESGHLLEFDDTPNVERIRILHRSLSHTEFAPNGDVINNVVGDSFLFNDANKFSHIIGNEFKTVGGNLSLILNSRKQPNTESGIQIGEGSNFTIDALGGDITIRTNGVLNLEAADINSIKIPKNSSSATDYQITERNLKFKKCPVVEVESTTMDFKARSNIDMSSSAMTASITGDVSVSSTGGNVTTSALNKIQETVTGKPFLASRTMTAGLGNIEFKSLDPTPTSGGFSFIVGPGLPGVPDFSEMKIDSTGLDFVNQAGFISFNTRKGFVSFNSAFGFTVNDKLAITLKRDIPGLASEISIKESGLINLKVGQTSLYKILNDLLTAIQSLSVGTPAGPSTPPINAAQFSKIQTELSTFLSSS